MEAAPSFSFSSTSSAALTLQMRQYAHAMRRSSSRKMLETDEKNNSPHSEFKLVAAAATVSPSPSPHRHPLPWNQLPARNITNTAALLVRPAHDIRLICTHVSHGCEERHAGSAQNCHRVLHVMCQQGPDGPLDRGRLLCGQRRQITLSHPSDDEGDPSIRWTIHIQRHEAHADSFLYIEGGQICPRVLTFSHVSSTSSSSSSSSPLPKSAAPSATSPTSPLSHSETLAVPIELDSDLTTLVPLDAIDDPGTVITSRSVSMPPSPPSSPPSPPSPSSPPQPSPPTPQSTRVAYHVPFSTTAADRLEPSPQTEPRATRRYSMDGCTETDEHVMSTTDVIHEEDDRGEESKVGETMEKNLAIRRNTAVSAAVSRCRGRGSKRASLTAVRGHGQCPPFRTLWNHQHNWGGIIPPWRTVLCALAVCMGLGLLCTSWTPWIRFTPVPTLTAIDPTRSLEMDGFPAPNIAVPISGRASDMMMVNDTWNDGSLPDISNKTKDVAPTKDPPVPGGQPLSTPSSPEPLVSPPHMSLDVPLLLHASSTDEESPPCFTSHGKDCVHHSVLKE